MCFLVVSFLLHVFDMSLCMRHVLRSIMGLFGGVSCRQLDYDHGSEIRVVPVHSFHNNSHSSMTFSISFFDLTVGHKLEG